MFRINRIGNKLGLAGLTGILMSLAMAANQYATERAVFEANQRAEIQQWISDNALKAATEMRAMQLAVRGVRLARDADQVAAGRREFDAARTSQAKLLDANMALALESESKDLFGNIRTRSVTYASGADEQAQLMLKLIELNGKRIALASQWEATLGKFTSMLGASAPQLRAETEAVLRDADGAMNAATAAGWRFLATGEADQKQLIARSGAVLTASIDRLRGLAGDPPSIEATATLGRLAGEIVAATNEAIDADSLKSEISRTRTVPIANDVAARLDSAVTIAQQAVADAKAAAASKIRISGQLSLGFCLVIVMALLGASAFSFLSVARPLTRLNEAMRKMAAGDLGVSIPGAKRGDEIGDMAKTIAVIRDNAERTAREEAEAKIRQDSMMAEKRTADMRLLADTFEGAVGEIVELVSSAAAELEVSANTLTETAEQSQALATAVAAASENASSNVQSVAAATEQMSSSINEISRQVQESSRVAGDAVNQATRTNARVGELSTAASRIGDVVELINTIAGQTNLLALNATIEAARAGDAGRGFAVVASEVKALAEQTARATGEIGQQIGSIQAATRDSVDAIREIGDIIGRMSEICAAIAAAVEQQGAATREISRNIQHASQGTSQVSTNISDVQRGASQTGSASSQVQSAAQTLAGESSRLKREVTKFLGSVRAA